MFHRSELAEYGTRFPHDHAGYVPVPGDHWRQMHFDHAGMDPDEEGISDQEWARRIDYLDTVWWPRVLARVNEERRRLANQCGPSFTARWERAVNNAPVEAHGFELG